MPTVHQAIDHLFRLESGKMIAVLSKLLGLERLDLAQDIVQDSLLQAMNTWPYSGIPPNPSAWLYRAARNRAIDLLRREKKFREIIPQYDQMISKEENLPSFDEVFHENQIEDSQLRMIFACCHPSIARESQVALALKTLCGLSASEIARAFLTNEENIARRIYRAREKIRNENIELEWPTPVEFPARLDSVLQALYLLFNEGYNSGHPEQLIREELCEEAMRLVYMLTLNRFTNQSRTRSLMALFCFQASRLRARLDQGGNIILLKYQDRESWFRPLMEKGFAYLDASIGDDEETSTFHLEAAIASLHASAKSFEETDWKKIYFLYGLLQKINPGPVVELNQAIASAYANGKEIALKQMLEIRGLENYYLYHTSVGELFFELNDKQTARKYFNTALHLTSSFPEQQFIQEKIRNCQD